MSGGLNIYGMIAGLGDAFGKSYDAAVKTQNEAQAPKVLGDLYAATAGGGAAGTPATTLGAMTQQPGSSLPSFSDTSGPAGSYVANLFKRESNNNTMAQAPTSSARGLGQFTKDTWNGVARKYPDLALTPVGGGQDGRIDPDQMLRATKAFTAENEAILNRANLPVNDATRYSLHFLGAGGGPKFVAGAVSNPDAPAIGFVRPEQVRANRSIFFGKDGRPKTAGEVLSSFGASFGGGRSQAPTAIASADEANLPVAGGQTAEFQIPPAASGGRVMTVPSANGASPAPPTSGVADAGAPPSVPTAQGFGGVPATRATMTPQLQTALNAAWKNPETRAAATQVFQHLLKGKESQWQLSTMGDQPVLFNQTTAQIVPVGQAKRNTATVGNSVIDVATGQPIYTAPEKAQSVGAGSSLVDPATGKVIFSAPDKESTKPVTLAPGATLVSPDGQPLYQAPDRDKTAETERKGREEAQSLRREIQGLASFKNYEQALPVYQSMFDAAPRNSKASDLNLVYGLGKIMDPGSVVREGEMVMVKNTGSLPDWLIGTINGVNGGQVLTPQTREAIMTEAHSRMQSYEGALGQDVERYRPIVDRAKMNPGDVLPTFAPTKAYSAPKKADAAPAKEAPKFGSVKIPPAAVGALKANPTMRADFDAKFGAGASDRILGKAKD